MRRCLFLGSLVLAVLFSLQASADERAALQRALQQAEEPMRDRDWAEAAKRLGAFRAKHAGTPEAIEAWVIEARSLLLGGHGREALAATTDFLAAHGAVAWAGRVRYIAADAYEALSEPGKSADVLRERVDAVTAPKARAAIAAMHLKLADEDFDGVETKDDLGRTVKKRNVQRAYQEYARALSVGAALFSTALLSAWFALGSAASCSLSMALASSLSVCSGSPTADSFVVTAGR